MRNIMALILSLASMLGYSDIPLFVKNVGDHINRSRVGNWNGTNMVFRYDFVKGDYLPPDGKGEIADVEVDSRVTYLETTNVYHKDGCSVEFLYYLNLTPLDRNLEWDMENNLCPGSRLFGQFQP